MKNMKRMFGALTALALGSTAAISVVACGNEEPSLAHITMDADLLQSMGVLNDKGETQLEVNLQYIEATGTFQWTAVNIKDVQNINLSATALVEADGTAKNDKAREFLTGTLGLTADKDGKFNKLDLAHIILIVSVNPELVVNKGANGYTFTKANITAYWGKVDVTNPKNEPTKIVAVDGLTVKQPSETDSVVKLDDVTKELALTDFDTSSEDSLLSNFKIGNKVEDVKDKLEGKNITDLLLDSKNPNASAAVKYMQSFIEFFKNSSVGEVTIKTTYLTDTVAEETDGVLVEGELSEGNALNFQIRIGSIEKGITFTNEFAFVLEAK